MEYHIVHKQGLISVKAWHPFIAVSLNQEILNDDPSNAARAETELISFTNTVVKWLKSISEKCLLKSLSSMSQSTAGQNIYRLNVILSFFSNTQSDSAYPAQLKDMINNCASGCLVTFQSSNYDHTDHQTTIDLCAAASFLAENISFRAHLQILGLAIHSEHSSGADLQCEDGAGFNMWCNEFNKIAHIVTEFTTVAKLKEKYRADTGVRDEDSYKTDLRGRFFNKTTLEEIEEVALRKGIVINRVCASMMRICERAQQHKECCKIIGSLYGLNGLMSEEYAQQNTPMKVLTELLEKAFFYLCLYEYIWLLITEPSLDSEKDQVQEKRLTNRTNGALVKAVTSVIVTMHASTKYIFGHTPSKQDDVSSLLPNSKKPAAMRPYKVIEDNNKLVKVFENMGIQLELPKPTVKSSSTASNAHTPASSSKTPVQTPVLTQTNSAASRFEQASTVQPQPGPTETTSPRQLQPQPKLQPHPTVLHTPEPGPHYTLQRSNTFHLPEGCYPLEEFGRREVEPFYRNKQASKKERFTILAIRPYETLI